MTDEEAAEAWDEAHDWGNYWRPYPHDNNSGYIDATRVAKESFLAGVEYGREDSKQREDEIMTRYTMEWMAEVQRVARMAWEAARAPRKIEPVFGVPGFLPVGQRYATFDDWKKEPQSFDPAQDEREHLERIRKEVEK